MVPSKKPGVAGGGFGHVWDFELVVSQVSTALGRGQPVAGRLTPPISAAAI